MSNVISSRRRLAALAAALLAAGALAVALGAGGCAANSSAASESARAKSMLDQHQYDDAIKVLEAQHLAEPEDKSITLLLVQAHLGAAGVELFNFISRIFGTQPAADDLDLFQEPDCSNEAIAKLQGFDLRCLAMRVLRELPNPDNPHVDRARTLLRDEFSQPAKTATDVNFLAAFVEAGSAFGRLRALLKRALIVEFRDQAKLTPALMPYGLVVHHLKRFFTEVTQALVRAKYSYGKVNKFVVSYEGRPIIHIRDRELVFSEELGAPQILRFAAEVMESSAEGIDYTIDHALEKNTQDLGRGTLRVLRSIDKVQFWDRGKTTIHYAFRFENGINRLLSKFSHGLEATPTIDVFGFVWSSPPAILKNLRQAGLDSWNSELSDPLAKYFTDTKAQWDDLNDILQHWEDWMGNDLTKEQQDGLIAHFNDVGVKNPDLFHLPTNQTAETMRAWQEKIVARLVDEMTAVLEGKDPRVPALSVQAVTTGIWLMQRSEAWTEANLWTVR